MDRVKREKLLILSGSFGDGHMQAAKAILEASALYKPGIEVKVVDFMELVHPRMYALERHCFLQWMKHFPSSYGYLYQKTRTDSMLTFFLKHIRATSQQRLLILLQEEQPTTAIITDHSDHSYWIQPSTDLYLVGSEGVCAALQRKGIARHKIAVTGISVRLSAPDSFVVTGDGRRQRNFSVQEGEC